MFKTLKKYYISQNFQKLLNHLPPALALEGFFHYRLKFNVST